jgi:hypothetical protein
MTQHRKMFAVAVFCAVAVFGATTMSACSTDSITSAYWGHNDQRDFNEYGLMLRDAGSTNATCASNAAVKLNAKLALGESTDGANYNAKWQGFLGGAYVTLVLATGMEAGGHGNLFTELDQRLLKVANAYQFHFALDAFGNELDPCGIEAFDVTAGKTTKHRSRRGNSCMDDHTIAVSGFGWVAAYLRASGRSYTTARAAAIDHTHKSLQTYDSICVHSPSTYSSALMSDAEPEICNGSISLLGTSDYRLISLNHGNQTPAYGFGLLTSMAAGFRGLQAAQVEVTELTTDDKKVLRYLWQEAKDHTDSTTGVFHNHSPNSNGDCYNVANPVTGNRVLAGNWGCEDEQLFWGDTTESFSGNSTGDTLSGSSGYRGYKAKWYPLAQFYTDYGLTKGDGTGWGFNSSEDSFFTSDEFFGPARRETYLTLAYDWYINASPQLTGGSEFRMAVKTYNGNYFTATSGGGSSMYATNTNKDDAYSTFRLLDQNGALLHDGDPVVLRITTGGTNYFATAVSGGGGTVNVNYTGTPGSNETFTIHKVSDMANSPGTMLNDGDKFALQANNGNYVVAENGGGGIVNANRTTIGPWETFTYTKTEGN